MMNLYDVTAEVLDILCLHAVFLIKLNLYIVLPDITWHNLTTKSLFVLVLCFFLFSVIMWISIN